MSMECPLSSTSAALEGPDIAPRAVAHGEGHVHGHFCSFISTSVFVCPALAVPLRENTFRYHWLCRAVSEEVEHLPLCWMYQALGGRRCQRPHEVMGSNPDAGKVFFNRTLLNTGPPLVENCFAGDNLR